MCDRLFDFAATNAKTDYLWHCQRCFREFEAGCCVPACFAEQVAVVKRHIVVNVECIALSGLIHQSRGREGCHLLLSHHDKPLGASNKFRRLLNQPRHKGLAGLDHGGLA